MFHQPDNSINWSQHRAELLALRKHFSAIISFRTHGLSTTLVFSKHFSLNCDNFCDKLELKRDWQVTEQECELGLTTTLRFSNADSVMEYSI